MIKVSNFGAYNAKPVRQAALSSDTGVEVKIISFGASIRDWKVPVDEGLRSVVLGFDSFDPYPVHGQYFGAIIGRIANRVGNAVFSLNGADFSLAPNEGPHQLHGGAKGLFAKNWQLETDQKQNCVMLSSFSDAGEMGYPGRVEFEIKYALKDNRLRIDFFGKPDRETPIALTQHNYFNLGVGKNILDHWFWIDSNSYTQVDSNGITTGKVLETANTIYDFSHPKNMRSGVGKAMEYDINLVLKKSRDQQRPAAIVRSEDERLTLKLFSDRPGLQLYNGTNLQGALSGLGGKTYERFAGFCLEDQMFPGALAQRHFPSIICNPDKPYRHWCEIEIA